MGVCRHVVVGPMPRAPLGHTRDGHRKQRALRCSRRSVGHRHQHRTGQSLRRAAHLRARRHVALRHHNSVRHVLAAGRHPRATGRPSGRAARHPALAAGDTHSQRDAATNISCIHGIRIVRVVVRRAVRRPGPVGRSRGARRHRTALARHRRQRTRAEPVIHVRGRRCVQAAQWRRCRCCVRRGARCCACARRPQRRHVARVVSRGAGTEHRDAERTVLGRRCRRAAAALSILAGGRGRRRAAAERRQLVADRVRTCPAAEFRRRGFARLPCDGDGRVRRVDGGRAARHARDRQQQCRDWARAVGRVAPAPLTAHGRRRRGARADGHCRVDG
eukprot:PhM_4_TR16752/c1_g2_i2/m.26750